jgi:DUF1009 family protein
MLFAMAARQHGLKIACVGIRHEASPDLIPLCDSFQWSGVGKLGGAIRAFKRAGARKLVMAGKVKKSVMFTPWRLIHLLPDWRMISMWYRRNRADNRDDSLMLSLIAEFERDGIMVGSALDYCPELLVKPGNLTRKRPSARELKDVRFGWSLAKEMGRLDVGQSVAVKERAALAVEAIEGTDRCIARAGELCPAGGWTLVKVAKPAQDMRFDVPTIGTDTIENLHRAGGSVLAIEAGRTILLDEEQVIKLADQRGIAIISVGEGELD